MKKIKLIFLFSLIVIIMAFNIIPKNDNFPVNGLVPNEILAIKIAEVILVNSFGEKILEERPFRAKLIENETVWLVQGSLKSKQKGGVVEILIQRKDCKVLNISHGK